MSNEYVKKNKNKKLYTVSPTIASSTMLTEYRKVKGLNIANLSFKALVCVCIPAV